MIVLFYIFKLSYFTLKSDIGFTYGKGIILVISSKRHQAGTIQSTTD
jgi:hypothetical protein